MYVIKGCVHDLSPSVIKESVGTVTLSYKWRWHSEGDFWPRRGGNLPPIPWQIEFIRKGLLVRFLGVGIPEVRGGQDLILKQKIHF